LRHSHLTSAAWQSIARVTPFSERVPHMGRGTNEGRMRDEWAKMNTAEVLRWRPQSICTFAKTLKLHSKKMQKTSKTEKSMETDGFFSGNLRKKTMPRHCRQLP
jgi:hypothetical protein